jgi:hypothetical protein
MPYGILGKSATSKGLDKTLKTNNIANTTPSLSPKRKILRGSFFRIRIRRIFK